MGNVEIYTPIQVERKSCYYNLQSYNNFLQLYLK
jgi:hypothetical protein